MSSQERAGCAESNEQWRETLRTEPAVEQSLHTVNMHCSHWLIKSQLSYSWAGRDAGEEPE